MARRRYALTPERERFIRERYDSRVKGRAAEIARALSVPTWRVKRWAGDLALAIPIDKGREWTPAEVAFLEQHVARRSTKWIAKRLGRTHTAVIVKLKRLEISIRAARENYSASLLSQCFGIDIHVVTGWIRRGWIRARRRETERLPVQGGDPWEITHDAVRDFVQRHPTAYRLDKVDQVWFLDLVFGGRQGETECLAS